MNEDDGIRAMGAALVARGVMNQAQLDAGIAAERGASLATAPVQSSSPAPVDAGIAQRADELVRTGQMTQEQAQAALAAYNAAPMPADGPVSAGEPAAPGAPAPTPWENVELDAGFRPPARPEEYNFGLLTSEPLSIDQLRWCGEVAHAAKLPQGIAQQVFTEVADLARENLDETALNLLTANTLARLTTKWGDQTVAKIDAARSFVRDLDLVRPGILRLLDDSGAGSSPIVIEQLALHAERIRSARPQ
jgi:hypothetical protein